MKTTHLALFAFSMTTLAVPAAALSEPQFRHADALQLVELQRQGLLEIGSHLDELERLRRRAASPSSTSQLRQRLHNQALVHLAAIDAIASTTEFEGTPLLSGDLLRVQLQTAPDSSELIYMYPPGVELIDLAIDFIDLSEIFEAQVAETAIANAIEQVDYLKQGNCSVRAELGIPDACPHARSFCPAPSAQ